MLSNQGQLRPMRRLLAVVLLATLALVGWMLIRAGYADPGTGFGTYPTPKSTDIHYAKTLWDWLQLLGVPVTLAVVTLLFNWQQARIERERARAQRDTDLQIASAQQQEQEFQTYLDRISAIIDAGKLPEHGASPELTSIVRARTMATMRRLDGGRNDLLLRFLREAHLVTNEHPAIPLSNADLRGADLRGVDLSDLDLHSTRLDGARLDGADLARANLAGASLVGAHLDGANLRETDLTKANLSKSTLHRASFVDAPMQGVNLDYAIGHVTNFTVCNMRDANLFAADFVASTFHASDLTAASMRYADFRSAEFNLAHLDNADLTGSRITESQVRKATTYANVTMPNETKLT